MLGELAREVRAEGKHHMKQREDFAPAKEVRRGSDGVGVCPPGAQGGREPSAVSGDPDMEGKEEWPLDSAAWRSWVNL